MPRRGVIPGFHWDARRKVARFEVTLPKTGGAVRRRRTIAVDSRDAALEAWRVFREEVLHPVPDPPPAPTVWTLGMYVDRYFTSYCERLRPDTQRTYWWIVRSKLLPRFGTAPISELTAPAIRDFVGVLKRAGLKATSINDVVAVLRLMVRDAFARGLVDALPYRGRLPREREELLHLELSDEERCRFLAAFDDEAAFRRDLGDRRVLGPIVRSTQAAAPRRVGGSVRPDSTAAGIAFARFRSLGPLFVIALDTGLRKGDLLRLAWRDVDLDRGCIRVTVAKTGRVAEVPISSACRDALGEVRARPVVGARVFVTEDGRPLTWKTVERVFKTAKRLAGITRRLRFHDLRHSLASRLVSRGVNLVVIARVLGHTSVRMAERYARASDEAMQSVAIALDASAAGGAGMSSAPASSCKVE